MYTILKISTDGILKPFKNTLIEFGVSNVDAATQNIILYDMM